MVTTHQQFVFEDASFSELPGLIFSSRYTTLALAATDATTVAGILVIDANWPATTTQTLDCDVMAGGGLIEIGAGQTITITGRVIGDSQIFDVSAWGGDPSLSGTSTRVPANPFPVLSVQGDVNAAWFGVCVPIPVGDPTPLATMRKRLQAAFCAVGNGNPSGVEHVTGCTVRIPGGYTYAFDRNTFYDGGASPLPYGILVPEKRDITVIAYGAVFDYRGSEFETDNPPSGLGTCAFAWSANTAAVSFFLTGFEWKGGQALPSATVAADNSDFLWCNAYNSRLTVRDLQIGQGGDGTGHRHGIVQCKWADFDSSTLTGQRYLLDNCDVSYCTDTGVIIVQCDGLMVSDCRIRFNGGSGIELGCASLHAFNGVTQSGTCSGAKILAGNYESNVKSGVKCVDARNTYVSADFEANAVGFGGNTTADIISDANVDFSGLYDYTPNHTGVVTVGSNVITSLSFDPTVAGWSAHMLVKDIEGKMGTTNLITGVTSTTITMTSNINANATIHIAAFLGTGDREGKAQNCTWSNSDSSGNALNVITQSATVLDQNLHDGTTPEEIGVLHLSATQPVWCTKEVFTKPASPPVWFSPYSWGGGVVTRESANTFTMPYNTSIAASALLQLTPTFTLDTLAVMVEAGGFYDIAAGHSATNKLALYRIPTTGSPIHIQDLTAGSATWEEGPYLSQRVGARLAHLTQAGVAGWVAGNVYAIFAKNGSAATANFAGGVVVRFCQIVPPT